MNEIKVTNWLLKVRLFLLVFVLVKVLKFWGPKVKKTVHWSFRFQIDNCLMYNVVLIIFVEIVDEKYKRIRSKNYVFGYFASNEPNLVGIKNLWNVHVWCHYMVDKTRVVHHKSWLSSKLSSTISISV